MKVGVTLPQFTDDPAVFVDGVERADAAGFDSMWVFDHLWPLSGGKERPILECWTALSWAAAATTRPSVGTIVTRSSLRHPAILAKMAATVAAIAPGRLIVAIGSGDDLSRTENEAFGLPYFERYERAAQLESTVRVVRSFFSQPEVSRRDAYVSIQGLEPSPRADPAPPVWVGGRSRELLAAAATFADGWNAWGSSPDRFRRDAARVTAAATGPFELSWGGQVVLGASDAAAAAALGERDPAAFVVGGPETVASHLAALGTAGATHLVIALPDASRKGAYERFAEDVLPRLRAATI